MPFADVEIYIQKPEADGRYPVDMQVDGVRRFLRVYLIPTAQPPAPTTTAHYTIRAAGAELFHWRFADRPLVANWTEMGRARRAHRLCLDNATAVFHRWPREALCEPARDGPSARLLATDPDTPFACCGDVNAPLLKPRLRCPVRMLVTFTQSNFTELYRPVLDQALALIDPLREVQALQRRLRSLLAQNLLTISLVNTRRLAAIVSALSQAPKPVAITFSARSVTAFTNQKRSSPFCCWPPRTIECNENGASAKALAQNNKSFGNDQGQALNIIAQAFIHIGQADQAWLLVTDYLSAISKMLLKSPTTTVF